MCHRYAGEKSTKTMPVISPVSKPSSMCWASFNTWAVNDLPGRICRAETSLLWYKDMFDNGTQAVQKQVLVQFVEVTQNGNWSEAFGLDGSFPSRWDINITI